MPSVNHLNTKAGSIPYKSLFSKVSIVPPTSSLAYISTQWASDPVTGELCEGVENDYGKQAKVIWTNITDILKELGAEPKDIVQKTVMFKCVEAALPSFPRLPFSLISTKQSK